MAYIKSKSSQSCRGGSTITGNNPILSQPPQQFFTIKKANTHQNTAHFNALGATIAITILVFFKAIK
jgi:hypothetical protein